MKVIFALFVFALQTFGQAGAFELAAEGPNREPFTLSFTDYIDTKTQSAKICSAKNRMQISKARLWMRMPNGHEHGTTPLQFVRESENCYRLSKLNFVMSGSWSFQMWDEKNQLITFPLFVAAKKYSAEYNAGQSAVTILLPPQSTTHKTKWLFCSEEKIEKIFLRSPIGAEIFGVENPNIYGSDCYEYDKLPLASPGTWSLAIHLSGGHVVTGSIDVQK